MPVRLTVLAIAILTALPCIAGTTSFDDVVAGLERRDGLFEVHLDADSGRLLLVLPAPDDDGVCARVLYAQYLAAGLGSNPVNLDRGQQGDGQLLAFRRVGGRLLVEAENWRFVARGADLDERMAVAQSFAVSPLWAGDILATGDDGRIVVDFAGFLLRDAHGAAARLKAAGQGEFTLDRDLSVVDVGATLVFPDNVELESRLSFRAEQPGAELRATAPDPRSVQLVQHVSLLRLPDDGYRPRHADPRMGAFSIPVRDFASHLGEPVVRHLATRHRLTRDGQPIVYHVDRGVPQPVRQALIDGASWWADAFEAAGFPGMFSVDVLPAGVHPLDARYNVIHWVHRATRGWSYGGFVSDPRTGEIVRGNVLLGSLRVRQDRMIFEGLVGASHTGSGGANDPIEAALARVRQLAAHEVGHAIGLAHNMAASTQARASVMDYPAPEIGIDDDGALTLADAYAVGVGAWDRLAIAALYGDTDPETTLRDGIRRGLLYVGDEHARAPGSGHPEGALWDTGADSIESLRHQMRVRKIALERFAGHALPAGRPRAELRERLVPIYLFHRYQAEAAAKRVGGLRFNYGTTTDGSAVSTTVSAERQWEALDAVLDCVEPEALDLPEELLAMLDPHEPARLIPGVSRELFAPPLAPAFDLTAAADANAAIVIEALLHHDRLARIDELSQRDPALPKLDAVLDRVVERLTDGASRGQSRADVLRRTVQWRLFETLAALSADATGRRRVRAAADRAIDVLYRRWGQEGEAGEWLRGQVEIFRQRRPDDRAPLGRPPAVPPGSPIGACSR